MGSGGNGQVNIEFDHVKLYIYYNRQTIDIIDRSEGSSNNG